MKSYPFPLPQHQHSPPVQSSCEEEYFEKDVSLPRLLLQNKGCKSQKEILLRENLNTISCFFVIENETLSPHF